MANIAKTARGNKIDVDLLKIKNDLAKNGIVMTPDTTMGSMKYNIQAKQQAAQFQLEELLRQEEQKLKLAAGVVNNTAETTKEKGKN